MSAIPPKADIGSACRHVRFVPKADSLSGNFTNAKWTLSPDGTGGTMVVDPPASLPPTSPPGLDHVVALFTQSAAGFSDQSQQGVQNTNPLSQMETNQQQFLANPHHG